MYPMRHTLEVHIYVRVYTHTHTHFLYIWFEIQPLCSVYLRECEAYRYLISKEFSKLWIFLRNSTGNDHREYRNSVADRGWYQHFYKPTLFASLTLFVSASVSHFIFQELLMQSDKVPVHFVEVTYVLFQTHPANTATMWDNSICIFFLFTRIANK